MSVPLLASSADIDSVGFLPDGRAVAIDAARRLRIYDARGAKLADLEAASRARVLRVSATGRRLLTVSDAMGDTHPPELWDVEHYRAIARLEHPRSTHVYSARFIANDRILTACSDGAARLWDDAGKLLQTYPGPSPFVIDVTPSPDGSMIVGGDANGVLRFWDTASGRLLWMMPAHRSYFSGLRMEGNDIITHGFWGDVARWTLPDPEQVIAACHVHKLCALALQEKP